MLAVSVTLKDALVVFNREHSRVWRFTDVNRILARLEDSGVWTRAVQCVTVVTGAYTESESESVYMDNKDVQYAFQSFCC